MNRFAQIAHLDRAFDADGVFEPAEAKVQVGRERSRCRSAKLAQTAASLLAMSRSAIVSVAFIAMLRRAKSIALAPRNDPGGDRAHARGIGRQLNHAYRRSVAPANSPAAR